MDQISSHTSFLYENIHPLACKQTSKHDSALITHVDGVWAYCQYGVQYWSAGLPSSTRL